jgi:hypothetical protein|tara:strand:- start:454 stop:786 length:333 start_codon:yes stop_codon:yes gene_type:complete
MYVTTNEYIKNLDPNLKVLETVLFFQNKDNEKEQIKLEDQSVSLKESLSLFYEVPFEMSKVILEKCPLKNFNFLDLVSVCFYNNKDEPHHFVDINRLDDDEVDIQLFSNQ